jgi:hypothetical protein
MKNVQWLDWEGVPAVFMRDQNGVRHAFIWANGAWTEWEDFEIANSAVVLSPDLFRSIFPNADVQALDR